MKKILALTLMASLLVMAGCGGGDDDDQYFSKNRGGSSASSGSGGSGASGPTGTASIAGKVVLTGKAAPNEVITFDADPVCKSQHATAGHNEVVLTDAKGDLANVFVYVKDGAANYPAPSTPVTLLQKGCLYHPRVMGIQVNQPLIIMNGDPTLHNVHCMAKINDAFNVGQPSQNMTSEKKFDKPEVLVPFKCDVHSWMHADIGVVSNPFFAITGTDGTFKIAGLPAGTYSLVAVHEKYGESQPTQVTVKDGEAATANFTFAAQ
ncbi:MAG TPA: carboxypeptidase regulatory-like domain-containing protein [bacterium]|nr:carboxypeptidase regulatory-like domain-containing protein [bacterium]